MKKLSLLLFAVFISLISCNSNEESVSNNILVKKRVFSSSDVVIDFTYNYNGNKIESIVAVHTNEGDSFKDKAVFTYTSNLITKVEYLNDQDVVEYTEIYVYDKGKLAYTTKQEPGSTYAEKTEYTHNPDGTINYVSYSFDTTTNQREQMGNGKLTIINGNLVQDLGDHSTIDYEYDDKNNPFKNVIGANLLLNNIQLSISNNITKATETNHQSGDSFSSTTTYTYNSNGYPTEGKEYHNESVEYTDQYFYE